MKKIITAIGNSDLNKRLNQLDKFNVLSKDISKDEELIEVLEYEKEIQLIFLNSKIIENYTVDEIIIILKKISPHTKIVLFKNNNINITIKEDDNFKIVDDEEIELDKIINIIEENEQYNVEECSCKIISVAGCHGIGKSMFSTLLAQNVENSNTKILLIDFDLNNNQLRTILKIKKKINIYTKIQDLIINVKRNLDVICYLDYWYNAENMDYFKVKEIIDELKNEYDMIIIDTSSDIENEYIRQIFYNSYEILFLIEPNILGVKKAKEMLEVFENDWKVNCENIKIIINKSNIYEISNSIMSELFPDYQIIGKLKYRDSYNLILNKHINKSDVKKEYYRLLVKI